MKKNIFKIFAGAAALIALASCELNETPVFDDKDAFVAMDVTSIVVDENKGTITIPVTIASINPMKANVTYTVKDSTAKRGTNFKVADESEVLLFDGKTRTMDIVIDILDKPGVADGDLIFTVDLLSAGNSLAVGVNHSCTIKISDLDHPLADILGTYTVTAQDAMGEKSFNMTISKDAEDPTVVWINPVNSYLVTYNINMPIYGNVSEDHKTISIPCGQSAVYDDKYEAVLVEVAYDASSGRLGYEKTGNITMTSEIPGTFTSEQGIGIFDDGTFYADGILIQGTIVWTKN